MSEKQEPESETRRGPAEEMFYLDEDGERQDADVHDQILAESDDDEVVADTRARLADAGWDSALLDQLYGGNRPFAGPSETDDDEGEETPPADPAEIAATFHPSAR